MLKTVQIILSTIGITLSVYGLITYEYRLNFLMILFLGLFMLTLGIKEFGREKIIWLFSSWRIYIFGICVYTKLHINLKS
ncbi:hypothetical protein ACE1MS_12830 [Lysinibacillus sp. fkY74-1]